MNDVIARQRRLPPDGLGPMLLAARQRRQLSLRVLGQLVDLTPAYIGKLEHGSRCPSRTVALRLADELHLVDEERAQLLATAVEDAGQDHPERRK